MLALEQQQQQQQQQNFAQKQNLKKVRVHTKDGISYHYNKGSGKDVFIDWLDMIVGGKLLLDRTCLRWTEGQKYGLIGRNGVGKSSLLSSIASGSIQYECNRSITSVFIKQVPEGNDNDASTWISTMDPRCKSLKALENQLLDQIEAASEHGLPALMEKLDDVIDRLMELEQETWRIPEILKELGFSDKMMSQPTKTLSGGWKMRLGLALAQFVSPDILLLDEPSNSLDVQGIMELKTFLRAYQGTFLLVSHSIDLLNSVCDNIILFRNKTLTYYPGMNYDGYKDAVTKRYKKQVRLQSNLDKKRKSMQDSIDAMTKQNRRARSQKNAMSGVIASRRKKLFRMGLEKTEDGQKWKNQTHGRCRLGSIMATSGDGKTNNKMQYASVITEEDPDTMAHIRLPAPSPLRKIVTPIIQFHDVAFAYDPSPSSSSSSSLESFQLNGLNMSVMAKSRIVIVGQNGQGKSTIVNLLAGAANNDGNDDFLHPTKGYISMEQAVVLSHFAQHQAEQLMESDLTALGYLHVHHPTFKSDHLLKLLHQVQAKSFGQVPVRNLSGGQRCKVILANLLAYAPNVLILDEATQHLDIDSIEGLLCALDDYEGAVIAVTHDLYILERLLGIRSMNKKEKQSKNTKRVMRNDQIWIVKHGKVQAVSTCEYERVCRVF